MNIRSDAVCLTFLCILSCNIALAQKSAPTEQTRFSADDGKVNRPVTVPAAVLSILKNDDLVRAILEDQDPEPSQLPANWFTASAIHLSHSGPADLLVIGEESLAGGNVAPFWVFRSGLQGPQLVLTTTALQLDFKHSRTHGLRDVLGSAVIGMKPFSQLFRFNGTSYEAPISKDQAAKKGDEEKDAEKTTLCDILSNADYFDGKTVEFRADVFGGLETNLLYDKRCEPKAQFPASILLGSSKMPPSRVHNKFWSYVGAYKKAGGQQSSMFPDKYTVTATFTGRFRAAIPGRSHEQLELEDVRGIVKRPFDSSFLPRQHEVK